METNQPPHVETNNAESHTVPGPPAPGPMPGPPAPGPMPGLAAPPIAQPVVNTQEPIPAIPVPPTPPIEIPPPPSPMNPAPEMPSSVAGAEKEEFPVFLVAPSTFSYIFSVFLILFLFLIYILTIGSIASFDGKFFPNVYMFWDFITTGNTKQYQDEFESYMKNVLLTSQNDMSRINSAAMGGTESFVGSSTSTLGKLGLDAWWKYLERSIQAFLHEVHIAWHRVLLNVMVRGNTIHVVR